MKAKYAAFPEHLWTILRRKMWQILVCLMLTNEHGFISTQYWPLFFWNKLRTNYKMFETLLCVAMPGFIFSTHELPNAYKFGLIMVLASTYGFYSTDISTTPPHWIIVMCLLARVQLWYLCSCLIYIAVKLCDVCIIKPLSVITFNVKLSLGYTSNTKYFLENLCNIESLLHRIHFEIEDCNIKSFVVVIWKHPFLPCFDNRVLFVCFRIHR